MRNWNNDNMCIKMSVLVINGYAKIVQNRIRRIIISKLCAKTEFLLEERICRSSAEYNEISKTTMCKLSAYKDAHSLCKWIYVMTSLCGERECLNYPI